ncbi:hypothetical protein V1264_000967 [Littorina saxatilis]
MKWQWRKPVAVSLAVIISLLLVLCGFKHRSYEFARDSYLAMSWEGFGPERGVYNFTVVTAMLDIGRGQWSNPTYRRSYNTYLLYMLRVLRLDVNMVVFVDSRGRPFVEWMRRGRGSHTRIVEIALQDLPYYAHRQRVEEIMQSAEYRRDNQLAQRGLCESQVPEYDILQWSKLYFVNQAIERDPFANDLFVWLDGGYGHGEDIHPEDGVWVPKNLFEHSDKVTFIERESVEKYRPHAARLHKMSINIIAGLFFAGGKRAFRRLYALQQDLIADWLKRGVVDDDQTTYMLMYFKEPSLFHLVPGDWNDVFTLFDQ